MKVIRQIASLALLLFLAAGLIGLVTMIGHRIAPTEDHDFRNGILICGLVVLLSWSVIVGTREWWKRNLSDWWKRNSRH